MKRFSANLFLFLLPIILLSLNYLRYENSGGDLVRLGKISIDSDYRKQFYSQNNKNICDEIDVKDIATGNKYNILSFGDSFSRGKEFGYQNYLASNSTLSVSNINSDGFIHENQIQTIYSITNSELFNF